MPPRFAVSVIMMNTKGMSRSRLMERSISTAKGKMVTSVMSFDKIIEQPRVTSTRTMTSALRLFTCSATECATNSSRPEESKADITINMHSRHTSVCQWK